MQFNCQGLAAGKVETVKYIKVHNNLLRIIYGNIVGIIGGNQSELEPTGFKINRKL